MQKKPSVGPDYTMLYVLGAVAFFMIIGAFSKSGSDDKEVQRHDTSEEMRIKVRDEMVRRGTDPNDTEIFTNELWKAEREWQANNP